MRPARSFWMYQPYAGMGTAGRDVCIPIVVGHYLERATGRTRYLAGCSVCGASILDYDRAVVQAVVDSHNAKVTP